MSARSWFLVIALAVLSAAGAGAHNAPGSALLLDFASDHVDAELRLPLSELEFAFRQPLVAEPATVAARFHDPLAAYVRHHLTVRSSDDQAWTLDVRDMHVALSEQPVDLVMHLTLHPHAGASVRHFNLHSDVISHEVMNHYTLVSVRSDWNNALLGAQPELLGTFRSYAKDLTVERANGSAWQGFHSVLMLGVQHIAEGTDHLLFLLVLLLPAPLLAASGKWGGYGGWRHGVLRLTKIVTAFTLGHSLTLLAGTVGWLRLPSQPTEVLIAVSIFVSAIHAFRPIFAGREPLIAAGFGLVHGLAFASVLAEFQLDAWHLGAALAAFNVGIELMQLLVVLAIVPWLLLLSRTKFYPPVRIGGAIFGGAAALGWIGERALGWPNPLGIGVELLAAHAFYAVGALAIFALAATLRWRGGRSVAQT